MPLPKLSVLSPLPLSHSPMNTIDLSKLSELSFSYDHLSRLRRPSPAFDLSPTSSVSSNGSSNNPQNPQDAFFATRSRVVRLYNLPAMAEAFLSAVFLPHNVIVEQHRIPVPATMWELRESKRRDSVWAVFRTHEEACAALSLSGRAMSVATALESDLEPFHKLQRFVLRGAASNSPAPSLLPNINTNNDILDLPPPLSLPLLRGSSSLSDTQTSYSSSMPENTKVSLGEYTLSSNPPNPKTSFRLGDWICPSPKCAAHNFGRNLACIGCGCPRSNNGNPCGSNSQQHPHQTLQVPNAFNGRPQPSPRFNNMSNNVVYYSTGPQPTQAPTQTQTFQSQHPQQHLLQPQPQPQPQPQQRRLVQHPPIGSSPSSTYGASSSSAPQTANPVKSTHPLLTPSGRAFAVGGKVQNISSDPLSPCIMYWPDNEPFPEQGQIRPSGLIGIAQPPILNTGNRGPISHQPGDWICQKCNYLNWRRRKVCQTCLPYAEGNGDSISAAVQAERIALLTSVLSQTQINGGNLNVPSAMAQAPRSHSLTPPQVRRPFIDPSPPQPTVNRSVHRSQSHFSLGQQYAAQSPVFTATSPIYQTSGNRQPSPLYSTGPARPAPRSDNDAANGLVRSMNHLSVSGNGQHGFPSKVNQGQVNSTLGSVDQNGNNNNMPVSLHAPAPLLPSFLQDIVQSPALSPTSTTTSSADLSSVEEYEDAQSPRVAVFPRARGDSGSSDSSSSIANIWRLDGEESKSLSAFPLPNHQELVGVRKIVGGEKIRV